MTEQKRKEAREKEKAQLKGVLDSIATGVSSSPIDMDTLEQKCILFGSPPCSPQIPNLIFLFCFFPLITAILIKSSTPSSIETNGSIEKILLSI